MDFLRVKSLKKCTATAGGPRKKRVEKNKAMGKITTAMFYQCSSVYHLFQVVSDFWFQVIIICAMVKVVAFDWGWELIPPLMTESLQWGPISPYGLGLIFPSPMDQRKCHGSFCPPDRTRHFGTRNSEGIGGGIST